jgi:hypothetical protein
MQKSRFIILIIPFLLALTAEAQADTAPVWVQPLLELSTSHYEKSEPFVILLDERITTVKDNGRVETRSRYVVRILTQEGRAAARREIQYDSETRISDLHAWHIRADQKIFELGIDKVIEKSIGDGLYSDIRSKVMRFGEVEIGSVVAFEWKQRESPMVNQDFHFFQLRSPILISRYQLNLPEGWRMQSAVFNCAPVKPVVEGNNYTWQVENLSGVRDELLMPDIQAMSPFLAVSYFPQRRDLAKKSIATWKDVSRWADQLMRREPRSQSAIDAKAAELVAGLGSDIEKVRAISRWVQKSIRYVSIQLGPINGYRPNPADLVLRNGYGDCKDKSYLMHSMLKSIGIESYITLVYSGDPTRVRRDFASPLQFNHAILAIAINSTPSASINHPGIGQIMFFDPTDDVTPLGDVPFYLQGSYGLVIKGDSGDLVRLPVSDEKANTSRREMTVEVEADGDIQASVKEALSGQMASLTRRQIASLNSEEYAREKGVQIASDIPGARINELKVNSDTDLAQPVRVEYQFGAANFANKLNKLLVIRPVLLRTQQFPLFPRPERIKPVLFEMKSVREDIVKIRLPEGFKIDELPANTEIKSRFGEFSLIYQVSEDAITVQRRLAITSQLLPPSEYPEVKKFFDAANAASQTSIVLITK